MDFMKEVELHPKSNRCFSTLLIPIPFITVPHALVTPNYNVILLLPHHYNFATVMSRKVNIWYAGCMRCDSCKGSQPHWFGNSRNRITRRDLFLNVLESRKWDNSVHDELLLREDVHHLHFQSVSGSLCCSSLIYRQGILTCALMSTWFSQAPASLQISSFDKNINHIVLSYSNITSSELIASAMILLPNKVNFWGAKD